MLTKIKEWLINLIKSDEDWYLENALDEQDLEIRILRLQRQGLYSLHHKYWYG